MGNYMHTLGSGQVEYTIGRSIIHFGSPDGATYASEVKINKPNMSVKEWINQND